MHGHINVKFPNNINKWQIVFNSAFKGLKWLLNRASFLRYLYVATLVPTEFHSFVIKHMRSHP
jgi:hypothetical protein